MKPQTKQHEKATERQKLPQGTQVTVNGGYRGAIVRHYHGGMYEIRLERGVICTDDFDVLTPVKAPNIEEGATLGALKTSTFAIAKQTVTPRNTPKPWHIAEYGIKELKAKYLCIKHGNRTIARIDAGGNSLSVTPTDEANAKLIVRSVNSAEKLAEALRECMADLEHYVATHGPGPDRRLTNAKAALARWDSGQ